MTKKISIISPCYNEEKNIEELYERIIKSIANIIDYDFEILFIDNSSTDNTVKLIKLICKNDSRVKLIVNERNFGHIRSPYWGILQTSGDATIYMASDLQDPPEFISKFLEQWEAGWKVVLGIKQSSEGSKIRAFLSRQYYKVLDKISDVKVIKNASGFGLYDKKVIDQLIKINDPYPFLRGLICDLGYQIKTIEFVEKSRKSGISKNNLYSLFDIAMLGIISHSFLPIRLASIFGGIMMVIGILLSLLYLITILFFSNIFSLENSILLILIFILFGVQFIFIGLLGEYICSIHTYVKNRPIIVEKERINF